MRRVAKQVQEETEEEEDEARDNLLPLLSLVRVPFFAAALLCPRHTHPSQLILYTRFATAVCAKRVR